MYFDAEPQMLLEWSACEPSYELASAPVFAPAGAGCLGLLGKNAESCVEYALAKVGTFRATAGI
jgi:hypothetical protein